MPVPTPEELEEQERLRQEQESQEDTTGDIPVWQKVVFESNQAAARERIRAENAERELAELRRPTIVEEPLVEGEPFANPAKFLDRIQRAMDKSVGPVNEFMATQNRNAAYNKLKNSIKRGANADALANFAKLEPLIDQAYEDDPSLSITTQEFERQIKMAVGTLTLSGGFGNNTPAPRVPNRDPKMIPPSVRPTPSVIRNDNRNEVDVSQLTENERRLAREAGMTPSEYVRMRDTPDHDQGEMWRTIKAERKVRAAGGR